MSKQSKTILKVSGAAFAVTAAASVAAYITTRYLTRVALDREEPKAKPPTKTIPKIIKSNLLTYFNLVFAVLAVLLTVAGSFRNMSFLLIDVANLLIGIVQEIRAKKVLDRLSVLNIWLGDVFGIEHMSMECVMLFVLFAIVTEPTLRYGTILVEKIGGIITKRAKK